MTKEEELEKIEQEIKKAQDKLGDIDNAINRESLVIEQKTKESSELLGKTKELKDELIVLEENVAEERQSLKIFKEDSKDKKDKLNNELLKKEEELLSTSASLTSDITSLEASKTGLIEQINTLSISLKNDSKIKEDEISKLDKEIEHKKSVLNDIKLEYNSKMNNYTSQVSVLIEKVASKTMQISELEDNLHSLEKKIDSKEKELYKISGEILDLGEVKSDLEVNIKELSSINESLLKEMKSLEAEKEQYVADKFALQRNKEDMDKREDFIKNKYQEAGVRYN